MSRWLCVAITTSIVSLTLAHCASQSGPKPATSEYPASFRALPDDLVAYYTSLAACEDLRVEQILKRFAASAVRRDYDASEFAGMLRSLQHLLTTHIDVPTDDTGIAEQPFPIASDDIIYVWIDPTCDRCALTVDQLRTLQLEQGSGPSLVFRLLPGESEIARYAATGLELLRQRNPDLFVPTLLETLSILPGSTTVVDQQLGPLMGVQILTSAPGFERAHLRVQQVRKDAGFTDYAPVIVYKNRLIRRDNTGSRVFDPFKDSATLRETIRFVRLEDARIRGEKRCQD
jgi:hypothetical protein